MTSKPDAVSALGYHWTDRTGRPLEPQVHWDATGTTLTDASTQWCSSGDPVLICIIGTHWKTTGKPLEDHWETTGSTLAFLQWHSSVHWGLSYRNTGLPLDDHWLRVKGWHDGHAINQLDLKTCYFFHILIIVTNIRLTLCIAKSLKYAWSLVVHRIHLIRAFRKISFVKYG